MMLSLNSKQLVRWLKDGKCCIFPFMDDKGVRYQYPVPLPDCRRPYCATKVDEQGHIAEWAFVKAPSIANDGKRKIIRGECCKFPFKENDNTKENNDCITNYYRDNGIEYFATAVDKDGVMTGWDYCAGTVNLLNFALQCTSKIHFTCTKLNLPGVKGPSVINDLYEIIIIVIKS